FPFHDERDTATEGSTAIDSYACKPGADESGPEIVYRVALPANGFLSAAVYSDQDVDVDVHLLSAFDPAAPSGAACLDRGDHDARADVGKGYAWVVVDTFASGEGALGGPYRLDIGFLTPSKGACGLE